MYNHLYLPKGSNNFTEGVRGRYEKIPAICCQWNSQRHQTDNTQLNHCALSLDVSTSKEYKEKIFDLDQSKKSTQKPL